MAAPAAQVSAFPAGHLLFAPLAGRGARLNQALVRRHGQPAAPSRPSRPSVAVLDAQSINCSERGVLDKGFDGHQKIRGRKRQLILDTSGLLLAAHVGPAHENDWIGGKAARQNLAQQGFERLHLVLVDAGYGGQPLAQWTRDHCRCRWRLETAPGLTGIGGSTPVPTCWVVERSINCLQWDRRLSRDHECETSSAEATVYLSSIRHLIRKF